MSFATVVEEVVVVVVIIIITINMVGLVEMCRKHCFHKLRFFTEIHRDRGLETPTLPVVAVLQLDLCSVILHTGSVVLTLKTGDYLYLFDCKISNTLNCMLT